MNTVSLQKPEHKCSNIAECMDQLRIMPRFLVLAGYIFFGILTRDAWNWFVNFNWNSIENEVVALAIIAFPTAFLSAFATVLGSLTKAYFAKPSHRDNNNEGIRE